MPVDDELRLLLTGSAGSFRGALQGSTKVGKDFDDVIGDISNGVLALNKNFRLVLATDKRFKASLQDLQSTGIQTTQDVQRQVVAWRLLRDEFEDDAVAVAQIDARLEQLNLTLNRTEQGSRQAEQALFSVGFILDDSAQFAQGFDQGVRAISNNIQPLIQSLALMEGGLTSIKKAFFGTGGLIIAANLLTTIPLLLKDSGDQTQGVDDLATAIGRAASGLIDIHDELPIFGPRTQDELQSTANGLQSLIDKQKVFVGLLRQQVAGAQLGGIISEDDNELLADAEQRLTNLNTVLTEYNKKILELEARQEAVSIALEAGEKPLGRQNETLKQLEDRYDELKETLRDIEQVGQDHFRGLTLETQAMQDQIDAILGRNKETKKTKTLLDQLRDSVAKNRTTLLLLTGVRREEITELVAQNSELERNIELQSKIIEIQAGILTKAEGADPIRRSGDAEARIERQKVNEELFKTDELIRRILNGERLEALELERQLNLRKEILEQLERFFTETDAERQDRLEKGIKLRNPDIGKDDPGIAAAKERTKELTEIGRDFDRFAQRLSRSISTGFTSAIQQFSSSIGEALVSGASFGDIGLSLLSSFATIGQRVGAILIQFGLGARAIQPKNLFSNPGLAIAAGVALLAASSAAKAAISAGLSGGGRGGSGGFVAPPSPNSLPAGIRDRPELPNARSRLLTAGSLSIQVTGTLKSRRNFIEGEFDRVSLANERNRF